MKVALYDRFSGPVCVTDVADPACPPDGVIVRVKACGVCRSDWHGWNGTDPDIALPHVGGHEFAGVVEAIGPDCRRFQKGERVTAPFILACGTCPDCMAGEATICGHQHVVGFSGWGAFAEAVAIPHADFNLVALPEALDFVTAAGMGCRVSTAFRALADRANLQPGEWVAVHGAGGVGIAAIMLAKALGARPLAIDISPNALALAEKFGAEHVLDAARVDDVGEAVRELTGGGAHVSLDALGIRTTFENSIRSLRKLGRHVQIGMPVGDHATVRLPLLELVYARQIAILGTRGIAASRFSALFDLVAAGKLDFSQLVTQRIPLSETGRIFEAMNRFAGAGMAVIDRFD